MNGERLRSWHWLLVAALAAGCGTLVPTPRTGPQTSADPIEVPYPPPPARVELIPDPPPKLGEAAVWVDGQWMWTGRTWEWQSGGWQEQLEDSYYARPTTARLQSGQIMWFPGAWIHN